MCDLCRRWQCRAGNGFHLLKFLHPPGYRKIPEAPATLYTLLPPCCPAFLWFGENDSPHLVSCARWEKWEGIWTQWHGVNRPELSCPDQLSCHWWPQDENWVRNGRTKWSIPKGTAVCLMSWGFLSTFFPQLFGLTAALPWVFVSLMASHSSWPSSLHQEGLSLCLHKGCVQALTHSEAFLFGRNCLIFRA